MIEGEQMVTQSAVYYLFSSQEIKSYVFQFNKYNSKSSKSEKEDWKHDWYNGRELRNKDDQGLILFKIFRLHIRDTECLELLNHS